MLCRKKRKIIVSVPPQQFIYLQRGFSVTREKKMFFFANGMAHFTTETEIVGSQQQLKKSPFKVFYCYLFHSSHVSQVNARKNCNNKMKNA